MRNLAFVPRCTCDMNRGKLNGAIAVKALARSHRHVVRCPSSGVMPYGFGALVLNVR